MKVLTDWCRKHPKLYIVAVYLVGGMLGFGLGYQFCLEVNSIQRIAVSVFTLLGAI